MKFLLILLLLGVASNAARNKDRYRERYRPTYCPYGFEGEEECEDYYDDSVKFVDSDKVINFSWKLFQQSAHHAPDIVVSPYSVQLLLSYLSTTAADPTKSQIQKAVGFEDPGQLNALRKDSLRRGGKREFQFSNLFMHAEDME
jgi:hypothetical protein